MRYIVETIGDLIVNRLPDANGEMLIRIDGFDNISTYNELAKLIDRLCSKRNLSVNIKLAKSKWDFFVNRNADSSIRQAMDSNDWVATEESITYYRNLHSTNVVVLLGTEDEEDKGGLMNIYRLTPQSLVENLNGDYSAIFYLDSNITEDDKKAINKLYKDLFEYVPIDICKLSDIADEWSTQINDINDFIKIFYASLPKWGLPYKKEVVPSKNQILSKTNVLKLEETFISRQMFTKLSEREYGKYKRKIQEYNEQKKQFSENWHGWSTQSIKSYEELRKTILDFIIGADVEKNRYKLINTDFSVIEDIFDLKLTTERKIRKSTINVIGDPLNAFMTALLKSLCLIKNTTEYESVDSIVFCINQAEIVSMYSEINSEDVEDDEFYQLREAWKSLCRYTNGIFDFIDNNEWKVSGNDIEIVLDDKNFFNPSNQSINEYIQDGKIKAAGSNKRINHVDFDVICRSGEVAKNKTSYRWKFSTSEPWNHYFSDICECRCVKNKIPYIPVTITKNLSELYFAKSEEEFFDLYDESDMDYEFNLIDFIDEHVSVEYSEEISAEFNALGDKFTEFLTDVDDNGFFNVIKTNPSTLGALVEMYTNLGAKLSRDVLPENQKWIYDAFIHALNREKGKERIENENEVKFCIVPAWHPAALEKLNDQKVFFVDGCLEWWNNQDSNSNASMTDVDNTLESLSEMCLIQSAVDIFPSYKGQYFGSTAAFGAFSVFGRDDIENTSRLKDMIHKDAIYDDDFNDKENIKMTDNAKMLYGVLDDYRAAFPESYRNMSIVFIDPAELQPIIASVYKFIETQKRLSNNDTKKTINITVKIMVKPENKGGRNYLAYWMDECFSQDDNVNIKTYLNEWHDKADIERLLNGNNDIVFVMDLLKVSNYSFVKQSIDSSLDISQCRFPIVFKPSPVSDTSSNIKRKIELSQPQFKASYEHTQVVRFRNTTEQIPDSNYIAVREASIDDNGREIVYMLHQKAYWVVCVDSGMDGALLRSGKNKDDYSIIGFSTGKGAYGQYNLTITARKTIVDTINKRLKARLYQLFKWNDEKIERASTILIREASGLDGISLLSAINQRDHNINEFMAYVLTSLLENSEDKPALKVIVHLDSYKHWFSNKVEDVNEDRSESRPDFLILEAGLSEDNVLRLKATVTECKIASVENAEMHKEKAVKQVKHGIERLSRIFDPKSKSIRRRYWYAQLYRALAYAQVTFSDNSQEFEKISASLRLILDGKFEIEWYGRVLGYWLNLNTSDIIINTTDMGNVEEWDIPQQKIQQLLLGESEKEPSFVFVSGDIIEAHEDEIENKERAIDNGMLTSMTDDEKNDQLPSESDTSIVIKTSIDNNEVTIKPVDMKIAEKTEKTNKTINDSETVMSLDDIRVLIGEDKYHQDVYWEYGNNQLANRHLLITGTSGQGKTYSIQTMLYELSKSNISSIIFDYTEGFRRDQLEPIFVEKMGDTIKERIVKFEKVPINPFKRQTLEMFGKVFPEKDADIAARFSNIMTHVYKFGDQQSSAIFDAVRRGLEKYQDSFDMNGFQEMLKDVEADNKTAKTVLSKMQPFFYTIDFDKDSNFDWGDIIYSEKPTTYVFQLTQIDRDMQVIITELMLWDLWYYTTKNGSKDKPFVVVLDEAQNLSHKDKSPSCKILTEGRKFGWSAWYATQSLKVLDDEEIVRLQQAAFKLYFKPTDDEITRIAKQIDPIDSNSWISSVSNLRKGECIVAGERIKQDGTFGNVRPTITRIKSFEERI